jgi:ribosomal-protein-alanine N-acetyltransferase
LYHYTDNLTSARLRTRFLTAEDAVVWKEFFEDKEATEFISGIGTQSPETLAKFWMHRQLTRYEEQKFGLQAILKKETGQLLGLCGLLKQNVNGREVIEVGYHFLKKHWGNGYAPEAAKIFIDYAFTKKITDQVVSIINVRNLKSQRVAEKNGLAPVSREMWNGEDVFIYSIQK